MAVAVVTVSIHNVILQRKRASVLFIGLTSLIVVCIWSGRGPVSLWDCRLINRDLKNCEGDTNDGATTIRHRGHHRRLQQSSAEHQSKEQRAYQINLSEEEVHAEQDEFTAQLVQAQDTSSQEFSKTLQRSHNEQRSPRGGSHDQIASAQDTQQRLSKAQHRPSFDSRQLQYQQSASDAGRRFAKKEVIPSGGTRRTQDGSNNSLIRSEVRDQQQYVQHQSIDQTSHRINSSEDEVNVEQDELRAHMVQAQDKSTQEFSETLQRSHNEHRSPPGGSHEQMATVQETQQQLLKAQHRTSLENQQQQYQESAPDAGNRFVNKGMILPEGSRSTQDGPNNALIRSEVVDQRESSSSRGQLQLTQKMQPNQQYQSSIGNQLRQQHLSPELEDHGISLTLADADGTRLVRDLPKESPLASDGIKQQQQQLSSLTVHQTNASPQLWGERPQHSTHRSDLERPTMYTYYEKAVTDMTDEADSDLLENWKKAWFDAGWQPQVIDESHARSVPEFDALVELIRDPKHIGTYNMACYIRWIAMAAVGGGFMADYDTFPLNHFLRHGRILPFDGALTVWSGHVPALVSGSGSEYMRIAKQIGRSMRKHVDEQQDINLHGPREEFRNHLQWSDMLALSEIFKRSQDMFIKKYEVVNAAEVLQLEEFKVFHCSMTDGMRAIHFSHKAMDVGKQAYRGAIHRGTVARQFLNAWHMVCPYTHVADV